MFHRSPKNLFLCGTLLIATASAITMMAGCESLTRREQAEAQKTSDPSAPKAAEEAAPSGPKFTQDYLSDFCERELLEFPGPYEKDQLKAACDKIQVLDDCESVNGDPIFHYDKVGKNGEKSKRVFAMSLIHGDEGPAGSVTRAWMTRLENLDPRNTWRVIPIVNPDGVKLKTRMNANRVDLNRNFPSHDWDRVALNYWKKRQHSDPRRYPGPSSASEVETRCIMKHLEEFKPDFIISIHTPLGVLDFDGPKVPNPNFSPLPWLSLGNFPGSLGRYMWVDRKVPVLTIELKGRDGLRRLEQFDRLQDITGTIAIQADKILQNKPQSKPKSKPRKK